MKTPQISGALTIPTIESKVSPAIRALIESYTGLHIDNIADFYNGIYAVEFVQHQDEETFFFKVSGTVVEGLGPYGNQ